MCGAIGGESRGQLDLEGDEASTFKKLIALGCGVSEIIDGGVKELLALGRMADRYQVEDVQCAVEDAVLNGHLTGESCGIILASSFGSGLERVARASQELALREFESFSLTSGFMLLGEDMLGSLLDDHQLTGTEERVFEGLVRWMKEGGNSVVRGEDLLRKIRFPFMEGLYLATVARGLLPEDFGLEGLVNDSCILKGVPRHLWAGVNVKFLDAKVLVPRGKGRWEDYIGATERRLVAGEHVYSVAAHGGYACGGLESGSIRVWCRPTLEEKPTLYGHSDAVWALLSAGGRLISGSGDHDIRVWDVAEQRCEGVLEGHTERVTSLAASGSRLLSGSWDKTVRVWRISGHVSTWRFERALNIESDVCSLAVWGGTVASGSGDGDVRVWGVETGSLEKTLKGHTEAVHGLVVSGPRLISSSYDWAIRVWSLESWACVQKVQVYPAGSPQFIFRLAVSGSFLLGGSDRDGDSDDDETSGDLEMCEVRVWELETLQPLHTLRLPAGDGVRSLVSEGGEVWTALGKHVVVWGGRG